MEDLIIYLYGFSGFVGCVGYLPQIYKYLKYKEKRNSISLLTWAMWSCTSLLAFLYGNLILKDTLLSIVTGINFSGTFIIFLIGLSTLKFFNKGN